MKSSSADSGNPARHTRLLATLEGLLAIEATSPKVALAQASSLVTETLPADKCDVFLYEPAVDTLIARGTSDTPMGRHEIALGLNLLPVSNGGKTVRVYQTGTAYLSGNVDQDPEELRGIKEALGVRSAIAVPLYVNGTRRGVLEVNSARPEQFIEEDLHFLEAVAHWIGLILYHAELVEQITQEAAQHARQVAADELITILAHDLRSPLTALIGRIFILRTRAEREGHQANLHDVTAISQTTNRLERMITDLLDTARLEQGIFALTPTVVDLAVLVRETVVALQTREGEIEMRTPDELPAMVDPQRIRQALENLLSNARRHSPPEAPVIVELGIEDHEHGSWAVVSVRDTGPGIAPEILPRIFTRFASSAGTKGLGLGLYLARGIAEAHGGTLTVESSLGQGATFHLAIPRPD